MKTLFKEWRTFLLGEMIIRDPDELLKVIPKSYENLELSDIKKHLRHLKVFLHRGDIPGKSTLSLSTAQHNAINKHIDSLIAAGDKLITDPRERFMGDPNTRLRPDGTRAPASELSKLKSTGEDLRGRLDDIPKRPPPTYSKPKPKPKPKPKTPKGEIIPGDSERARGAKPAFGSGSKPGQPKLAFGADGPLANLTFEQRQALRKRFPKGLIIKVGGRLIRVFGAALGPIGVVASVMAVPSVAKSSSRWGAAEQQLWREHKVVHQIITGITESQPVLQSFIGEDEARYIRDAFLWSFIDRNFEVRPAAEGWKILYDNYNSVYADLADGIKDYATKAQAAIESEERRAKKAEEIEQNLQRLHMKYPDTSPGSVRADMMMRENKTCTSGQKSVIIKIRKG